MKKDHWFHKIAMSSNPDAATKEINIRVHITELTEEILNFRC
jgi:hypothetical protein